MYIFIAQSMENIQELKKQLRHGDYQLISELSTVPAETVKSILNGTRNPKTPRGRQVLAATERLVESRKQLLAAS